MLEVTSIEQLKIMSQGETVPLPSFVEGMPFNARVRKPSLLNLIQKGTIPNSLLSAANDLFYGKNSHKKDTDVDMKEVSNLMLIMAKEALLEPSPAQLEEVGLVLTDEQLVALFNYTQKGLKAMGNFRTESEDNVNNSDEQTIQNKAESGDEPN